MIEFRRVDENMGRIKCNGVSLVSMVDWCGMVGQRSFYHAVWL